MKYMYTAYVSLLYWNYVHYLPYISSGIMCRGRRNRRNHPDDSSDDDFVPEEHEELLQHEAELQQVRQERDEARRRWQEQSMLMATLEAVHAALSIIHSGVKGRQPMPSDAKERAEWATLQPEFMLELARILERYGAIIIPDIIPDVDAFIARVRAMVAAKDDVPAPAGGNRRQDHNDKDKHEPPPSSDISAARPQV